MHLGAALTILLLVASPLICAVNFAFSYKRFKQQPSWLWLVAFTFPWLLLFFAAIFKSYVLIPFAFLLAGIDTIAWVISSKRRR
ncbi:MAG: hypothetical protein JW841_03765 [Deltaproteobacteria bacterium]|nr:hypothetical protein [Deltaproteobacteria bacterium]